MPGFKDCFVVDVAPQLGIRQTRMLEGEYVRHQGRRDGAGLFRRQRSRRGRDYYTPYRAMLPREVEGLIVCRPALFGDRSRTENVARKFHPACRWASRPVWPAALALSGNIPLRRVDPRAICVRRCAPQGGDPGDQPSANAKMMEHAA